MNRRTKIVTLVGLVVALLLAGAASYYASSSPDGLNRVASDMEFAEEAEDHALDGSPLAGYSLRGVDNERLSGGLAGVLGVGLTFVLGGAVALAVRRLGAAPRRAERDTPRPTPPGGSDS